MRRSDLTLVTQVQFPSGLTTALYYEYKPIDVIHGGGLSNVDGVKGLLAAMCTEVAMGVWWPRRLSIYSPSDYDLVLSAICNEEPGKLTRSQVAKVTAVVIKHIKSLPSK